MLDLPDIDIQLTAIDLETTGLHPFHSEIIEVGAVRFSLNDGKIEEYSKLIKPLRPISPSATAIHGIDDLMVAMAPSWSETVSEFYDFISDSLVIAHNAPFDISFLQFYGMIIGQPFPETYIADTLIISREVFPDHPKHSLTGLVNTLGIQSADLHRALADARACMEIFRKAIKAFIGTGNNWKSFAELYIFHTSDWQNSEEMTEKMTPIVEACQKGQDIILEYIDSRGVQTTRRITPLQLLRIRQIPYLIGHCHLRHTLRNFRLDRINFWKVL